MKVTLSEIKKNLQGINSERKEARIQINDLEQARIQINDLEHEEEIKIHPEHKEETRMQKTRIV